MKYLITGGAGFIGSYLSEALIRDNHHVIALDNFSTGSPGNVERLVGDPAFQLVEGSILDESLLTSIVPDVDVIFHLAAAVGVKFIVEHLTDTLETNTRGTEIIIKLAHQFSNKKVVLASTSEVYGRNAKIPHQEDDDLTIGPTSIGRWGYACSKMMDELLALAYHKEFGLPVVILRLFNTVGPGQTGRYGMVIPNFVSNALHNEPISVYGDGTQRRCFIHIRHVVQGLIDISNEPRAEGHIFNMGGEKELSISELAVQVKDTLASGSPIVYVPYDKAYNSDFQDILRRVPDISKIKSYIHFQPTTDITSLIKEVAESIKANPGTLNGNEG